VWISYYKTGEPPTFVDELQWDTLTAEVFYHFQHPKRYFFTPFSNGRTIHLRMIFSHPPCMNIPEATGIGVSMFSTQQLPVRPGTYGSKASKKIKDRKYIRYIHSQNGPA